MRAQIENEESKQKTETKINFETVRPPPSSDTFLCFEAKSLPTENMLAILTLIESETKMSLKI